MTPEQYDAWYDTSRGCWIGETEYQLIRRLLDPHPGESLLDVGCGTGWFTRAAVADLGPITVPTGTRAPRSMMRCATWLAMYQDRAT